MTDKQQTGRLGENLAAEQLTARGYRVVARNYRHSHAEIDLIAWDGDILVFIEVKTRKNSDFGHPSGFLSAAQQKRISHAASHYMEEIDYDWEIRFDVIAVILEGPEPTVEHVEDAWFPGLF